MNKRTKDPGGRISIPDFQKTSALISGTKEIGTIPGLLNDWMGRDQPCLFAGYAAKNNLLDYFILDEQEFLCRDEYDLEEIILHARQEWEAKAFAGKSIGFILYLRSGKIINTCTRPELLYYSKKLASLFLKRKVVPDSIELVKVFLKHPDDNKLALCWDTPVNYFSQHAYKKWWDDRKIPGGIAFSVNSVGHAVHSKIISEEIAKHWSVKTIRRTQGSTGVLDSNLYQSNYNNDYMLPYSFFINRRRPASSYEFSITENYTCGVKQRNPDTDWNDKKERKDGSPYMVKSDQLPDHLVHYLKS